MRARIDAAYHQGMTVVQIAAANGCRPHNVYTYLAEHGLLQAVLDMRREGMPYRQVVEELRANHTCAGCIAQVAEQREEAGTAKEGCSGRCAAAGYSPPHTADGGEESATARAARLEALRTKLAAVCQPGMVVPQVADAADCRTHDVYFYLAERGLQLAVLNMREEGMSWPQVIQELQTNHLCVVRMALEAEQAEQAEAADEARSAQSAATGPGRPPTADTGEKGATPRAARQEGPRERSRSGPASHEPVAGKRRQPPDGRAAVVAGGPWRNPWADERACKRVSAALARGIARMNERTREGDAREVEERLRARAPEVLAAMLAAKRRLCLWGSVNRRDDAKTYRLRFQEVRGGRTVHHAIALGSDAQTVRTVCELVCLWRRDAREDPEFAKREIYESLSVHIDLAGLGVRQTRRLKRYARRCVQQSRMVEALWLALNVDRIPKAANHRPPKGARWGRITVEAPCESRCWDPETQTWTITTFDEEDRPTERRVPVSEPWRVASPASAPVEEAEDTPARRGDRARRSGLIARRKM